MREGGGLGFGAGEFEGGRCGGMGTGGGERGGGDDRMSRESATLLPG